MSQEFKDLSRYSVIPNSGQETQLFSFFAQDCLLDIREHSVDKNKIVHARILIRSANNGAISPDSM